MLGHLQLESDIGSNCNKLRDMLSYSRRFIRVKRNLPGPTVRICVYRKRQLNMFQYFAHKTQIYSKTLIFIVFASYYTLHS